MSMTHDEMIAVIAAHRDGKTIQFRTVETECDWRDIESPVWDFQSSDYRIKPEPLECWVNVYEHGTNTVFESKVMAEAAAQSYALRVAVHMKEVES
jgi:hypothetical protein